MNDETEKAAFGEGPELGRNSYIFMSATAPRPAPPFCKWRSGGQGALEGGGFSAVGWHAYRGLTGRRTLANGYPARWAGLRDGGPLGLGCGILPHVLNPAIQQVGSPAPGHGACNSRRTGPGLWAFVQSRSKTGAPLEWRANQAGRASVSDCNSATGRRVPKRGHVRALQKVAGGRLFHNRAGIGQS